MKTVLDVWFMLNGIEKALIGCEKLEIDRELHDHLAALHCHLCLLLGAMKRLPEIEEIAEKSP